MNRMEFMKILESKLSDISINEKREAVEYYNDYFDDAGVENEQEVMDSLGSPEQVAESIKADLYGKQNGEFTETGYKQGRGQYHPPVDVRYEGNRQERQPYEKREDKDSTLLKIILIVLICFILSPIIIPLGLAVVAVIIGLLVALFGILAALGVSGFALLLAGIICIVVGFVKLFINPLAGAIALGIGLLLLGIGALLSIVIIWMGIKIFPIVVRGIVNVVRIPFDKIRRK